MIQENKEFESEMILLPLLAFIIFEIPIGAQGIVGVVFSSAYW